MILKWCGAEVIFLTMVGLVGTCLRDTQVKSLSFIKDWSTAYRPLEGVSCIKLIWV